ncbi:MAG: nucleoside-diphosphate kinase [Acidilobaceae archaeon]
MAVERTLIVIKPDAVRRSLVGEILSRFEKKGFKIVALKMLRMTKEQAEEFYRVHKYKPFFNELVEFITSGPVVAAILEGESAISVVRLMIGSTDARKAEPGTIRGDYGLSILENLIHASDSPEMFVHESKILFSDEELKALL